jgi:hypothetical protein
MNFKLVFISMYVFIFNQFMDLRLENTIFSI